MTFRQKGIKLNHISVGVNCHFDPFVSLDALKVMKKGLVDANLLDTTYLMCQPLGYFTPDAGKQGFIDLPEFPFGLEPRICTRWDMHRYAKESWELGVRYVIIYKIASEIKCIYQIMSVLDYVFYAFTFFRYIGGCCGFEAYHIRAVSEVNLNL